jgi:hypothetical protein
MPDRRKELYDRRRQQNRIVPIRYGQSGKLRRMICHARAATEGFTVRWILGFTAAIGGALGRAVAARATLHRSLIGDPGIHAAGYRIEEQKRPYYQANDVSGAFHRR